MYCIVYNQTMPFTMPIVQQCQMCALFLPPTTSLSQDKKMALYELHKWHCTHNWHCLTNQMALYALLALCLLHKGHCMHNWHCVNCTIGIAQMAYMALSALMALSA